MAEYQPILTQIAIIIGAVLLCILSIGELNRDLMKSKNRFRYWSAVVVFLAINLSVYLLLTYISYGESPFQIAIGEIEVQGEGGQALRPLLISLFYFGAGAGTFKLGGKDFHLYKSLLQSLEGMFATRLITLDQLKYSEFSQKQVFKELKEIADVNREAASEKGWDKLESDWKDFIDDEQFIQDEIVYLGALQGNLQAVENHQGLDPQLRNNLNKISAEIASDIERLMTALIKRLQKYLVRFAFKNFKDEAKLETFLLKIKVEPQSEIQIRPNCWVRAMVIGFMFGLIAGPAFGLILGLDPLLYAWVGSVSIMLFLGFVVAGINARSLIGLIALGALGGYFGHVIWLLLRAVADGHLSFAQTGNLEVGPDEISLLYKAIVGLSFGVATALVVRLLQWKKISGKGLVGSHLKLSGLFKPHAALTVSGALVYPLLYAAFYPGTLAVPFLVASGVMGVIVMNAAGVAVDLGGNTCTSSKPFGPMAT